MRISAATLAVVLVSSAFADAARGDTSAWQLAHSSPRTAAETRFDTLRIENQSMATIEALTDAAVRRVGGWKLDVRNVTKATTKLSSSGLPVTSKPDSAILESEWVTYSALWPLRKGGAESFFTTGPDSDQPSAFEPRPEGPASFEEIQLRFVVKLTLLPKDAKAARRGGLFDGNRALVIASAQFVGSPFNPDGVRADAVELRSSGLLEQAIFERLRTDLRIK